MTIMGIDLGQLIITEANTKYNTCRDCGRRIPNKKKLCAACRAYNKKRVDYAKAQRWIIKNRVRWNFYKSKKWKTIRELVIQRAGGLSEISSTKSPHMDVHHINDDWTDNSPENLIYCTDAEHRRLHAGTLTVPETFNPELTPEWIAALRISYKPLDEECGDIEESIN